MPDAVPGELDSVRVARLPGVVGAANAMNVRDELACLLGDGVSVLVADMSATAALAQEGLQAVVLARAAARSQTVPSGAGPAEAEQPGADCRCCPSRRTRHGTRARRGDGW
jgi:hypothetical protein